MIAPWIQNRFPGKSITLVEAGWSDDVKYRIETSKSFCLLRVSPLEAYARKQEEYAQLARLNEKTDAFPRAIEHGRVVENELCYVLYEWMEGREALTVFPSLTEEAKYHYGIEAGKLLRVMHDLPQEQVIDAHAYVTVKVEARRQQMRELKLEFEGYDAMVDYLTQHLSLIENSPTVFRHGDYHLGNMLIEPQGRLKVIDFNRSDFGDPIEDFNRLFTFSRQTSISFARGQIEGYYSELPPSFFEHALCYVLLDCAFGLLWAQRFGQKEIDVHFSLVKQIMHDFDGLKTTRPGWMNG